MGWPQSQDYNEAIQNAKTCFKDPELSRGAAVTNPLGMPLPCSGNFADVYQVHCPETKTRWAVKCFTRGDPKALEDRYAKIDQHLQQAKLPFAVGFRYLVEGIRIRKEWHPVLKMQWVEGFTLNHFVRDNLDKPNVLDALLQIWVRMGKRLREADMAHADLQHGNVMLVAGSTSASLAVKLIDYDGMWVPALAGQKSGEVGHPAYQHTKRLYEGTYSKEVDRFPLLVVATALRCLRVTGKPLWEKFDNGDNLLFREADLAAPERSPLFAELTKTQDAQAKKLVDTLLKATTEPLEDTPPIDVLLGEPARKQVTATKPVPAAPTAEAAFADLGDPESPGTSSARRRSDEPAPKWKKWAMIGGGAGAALLATVLVLALSGGKKEPDHGDKREPIQADNRKDAQPSRTTQAPPPPPQETPLSIAELPDVRIAPGATHRFVIKVNGLNSEAGLKVAMQDMPSGVRSRVVNVDPRAGVSEWQIDVAASVPPTDKLLTVVAEVGARTAQTKLRLIVPEQTVVKPPPPPQESPVRSLGQFTTDAPILRVAYSQDGQRGLAVTNEHVYLFDPANGKVSVRIAAPEPPITGAAWMPDNLRYLLAGKGRLVIVDPQTKTGSTAINATVTNHTALALSGDGRRVAVVKEGGGIELYDLPTRKLLHTVPDLVPSGHQLAFTQDGKRLLVASPQPKLKRVLLDVETGKELFTLDGTNPTPNLLSLGITPDGKRAVFSYAGGQLQLWDLENNRAAGKRLDLDFALATCALAPDARHVLAGSDDGLVRLWETASAQEVRRLEGHNGAIRVVALAPDGRRALTAGSDRIVRCWDLSIPAVTVPIVPTVPSLPTVQGDRVLERSTKYLTSLAVSGDGRKVYAVVDSAVQVWDTHTGQVSIDFQDNRISQGAILPDGTALYVGGNRTVYLRDPKQAQPRALSTLPAFSQAAKLSRDGKRGVVTCGTPRFDEAGKPILKDGVRIWDHLFLKVWDLEEGKELHSLPLTHGYAGRLAVNADGKFALAQCGNPSSNDRRVLVLWDLVAGRVVREHVAASLTGFVVGMDLSADGRRAALALDDRSIVVWDLGADKLVARFGPFPENLHSLVISPDGRLVVSGGGLTVPPQGATHCFVRILNVSTGKEVVRKEGHKGVVHQVALSADARWAASVATPEHEVRLWDLTSAAKAEAPTATPPAKADRTLPPTEKQRADALVNLKQVYADEYAKARPTDRVARLALADLLLTRARDIKDNATDRYVLIQEAAEIYQQLGSAARVFAALDVLADEYAVDRVALKENALNDLGRQSMLPAAQKPLAEAALTVMDDARDAESFEALSRLADFAEAAATKSQDAATRAKVNAAVKEAREVVKESQAALAAAGLLTSQPEDATANLTRGKFLCFRLGAWQRGLPLLAKGEDAKLKEMAVRDTATPDSAEERAKLADAWFDYSKTLSTGKAEVLRRAAHWYTLALDAGLTALSKERVETQLKAIEPQLPPARAAQASGERLKIEARGAVARVAYLPDGGRLVTCGNDLGLQVWDLRSGKDVKTLRPPAGRGVVNLIVGDDGWIGTSEARSLRWTDATEKRNSYGSGFSREVLSLAYVGKSKRAVVGFSEGRLTTVEEGGGETRSLDFKNPAGGFTAVAGSAVGGGLVLAGSESGTLLLYSLQAGTRQTPLRLGTHAKPIVAVALTADGTRAVSVGEDKTIRVWDVKLGRETRRLVGHSGAVTDLALSPDGRRVATCGEDGTVRVWDMTTYQELRRFVGHKGKVNGVAFSPDGRRLASAGDDGTIRIWGQ